MGEEEHSENVEPSASPDQSEWVDPDKVKITGEAIARSWWQILLAAIFGGW